MGRPVNSCQEAFTMSRTDSGCTPGNWPTSRSMSSSTARDSSSEVDSTSSILTVKREWSSCPVSPALAVHRNQCRVRPGHPQGPHDGAARVLGPVHTRPHPSTPVHTEPWDTSLARGHNDAPSSRRPLRNATAPAACCWDDPGSARRGPKILLGRWCGTHADTAAARFPGRAPARPTRMS